MFDLAVIGGGPAGYSAALEAVRHGLTVAMFENDRVGGTCLNRGCVPTKYLSNVARKYYEAQNTKDGLLFRSLDIDYEKTLSQMNEIILSLRTGLTESLKKSGIEIISGNAAIKQSGVIACNGEEFKAGSIIIATGSCSNPPLVAGSITSDEILKLDHIPDKLHILGGGAIAVEFAEIFRMLGSDVSISIRGERILKSWDKDISAGLTHSMKKKGIGINKGCDLSSMIFTENGVVMSAAGRRANIPITEDDVFDVGENGGITVDEYFQTKTKGIFAVGDVAEGSGFLAHTAMDQGRQAARFIAKGIRPRESSVIRCIYPDQEVASVGITEADAKEQGIECITVKQTMYANARTVISTNERGFIKVVSLKEDGRILGAQLMCEHAGEIIAEFAQAIDNEMTVCDMLRSVRPHPSYCEAVGDALRTMEDRLRGL